MRRIQGVVVVVVALIAAASASANARVAHYAPVDQPGPPLSVPRDRLSQSLRCTSNLVSAGRAPVLFATPTLVNPDEAFFGYERAFDAQGIPYCTLTIPDFTTEDIQVSAEYVVYGIRTIHSETRRRVDVLGWSQGGGPEPRWALRFWPDIRPMVAKLIDLEAPNHGTILLHTTCAAGHCLNALCPGHCSPAIWQQADNSAFTAALNSGQETFPGIAYTNVYSHTSQFVQPNLSDDGTTSLHGGGGAIANIATQSVCPLNVADHLAYWYDPVGYALVMDALTHPGPADPARINRAVCLQLTMPYVNPLEIPTYTAHLYNVIFLQRFYFVPQTASEPPLKCYVTASCATSGAQRARGRHSRLAKGRVPDATVRRRGVGVRVAPTTT
jgi:triacylglycerol esterase/lipase EstA (alpha/beta hydrolase family)